MPKDGSSRKQRWLVPQSQGERYAAYVSPGPAVALRLPIDDPAVKYRQNHLGLRDLVRRDLKDVAR
jgi:hypothetical protein